MERRTVALLLSFFLVTTISITYWLLKPDTREEVYYHDFRNDYSSNTSAEKMSGWGNRTFTEEGLVLSQGSYYCGCVFVQFRHDAEWAMETCVKVVESGVQTNVQILTREGKQVKDESGMTLYINSVKASARHKINGTNELDKGFTLPFNVQLNAWYKLKFLFYQGKIECYINDVKYFEKSGLGKCPVDYTQPHLAVFNGTAIFQYIKIWNLGSYNILLKKSYIIEPEGISSVQNISAPLEAKLYAHNMYALRDRNETARYPEGQRPYFEQE